MKAYLANGLFTIGDRIVNDVIARELRARLPELELFVPQEATINDKSDYADSVTIAQADTKELMESDFMVAVIDGVEIDSGVSAEIGMFSTTGKPIYALYSDIRQQGREHPKKLQALMDDATENQWFYRNLFVIGLIKQTDGGVYDSIISLIKTIEEKQKGE